MYSALRPDLARSHADRHRRDQHHRHDQHDEGVRRGARRIAQEARSASRDSRPR